MDKRAGRSAAIVWLVKPLGRFADGVQYPLATLTKRWLLGEIVWVGLRGGDVGWKTKLEFGSKIGLHVGKFPVRLVVVYADMGSFDFVAASLRGAATSLRMTRRLGEV